MPPKRAIASKRARSEEKGGENQSKVCKGSAVIPSSSPAANVPPSSTASSSISSSCSVCPKSHLVARVLPVLICDACGGTDKAKFKPMPCYYTTSTAACPHQYYLCSFCFKAATAFLAAMKETSPAKRIEAMDTIHHRPRTRLPATPIIIASMFGLVDEVKAGVTRWAAQQGQKAAGRPWAQTNPWRRHTDSFPGAGFFGPMLAAARNGQSATLEAMAVMADGDDEHAYHHVLLTCPRADSIDIAKALIKKANRLTLRYGEYDFYADYDALTFAAQVGDVPLMVFLMSAEGGLFVPNQLTLGQAMTPEAFKLLLDRGVCPDAASPRVANALLSCLPMHATCDTFLRRTPDHNKAVLEMLLDHNTAKTRRFNLNARCTADVRVPFLPFSPYEPCPIMLWAVLFPMREVPFVGFMQRLIAAGADINATHNSTSADDTQKDRNTSAEEDCRGGGSEGYTLLRVLLEGATAEDDWAGATREELEARAGVLLSLGADPTIADKKGVSPQSKFAELVAEVRRASQQS